MEKNYLVVICKSDKDYMNLAETLNSGYELERSIGYEDKTVFFLKKKVEPEVKGKPRIISLRTVPLDQVDEFLEKGYELDQVYKDHAIMVKKA